MRRRHNGRAQRRASSVSLAVRQDPKIVVVPMRVGNRNNSHWYSVLMPSLFRGSLFLSELLTSRLTADLVRLSVFRDALELGHAEAMSFAPTAAKSLYEEYSSAQAGTEPLCGGRPPEEAAHRSPSEPPQQIPHSPSAIPLPGQFPCLFVLPWQSTFPPKKSLHWPISCLERSLSMRIITCVYGRIYSSVSQHSLAVP
jgi:hypothetical protein